MLWAADLWSRSAEQLVHRRRRPVPFRTSQAFCLSAKASLALSRLFVREESSNGLMYMDILANFCNSRGNCLQRISYPSRLQRYEIVLLLIVVDFSSANDIYILSIFLFIESYRIFSLQRSERFFIAQRPRWAENDAFRCQRCNWLQASAKLLLTPGSAQAHSRAV